MSATRIVVLDSNEEALALTRAWGADVTVVADGSHVSTVLELTDGKGAEVVLDFVGERGAERDSWAMTRRAGSDFVIGYGGTVDIPTIDVISTERSVVGNLVGSYNDLVELMVLAADGKVEMLTQTYPLDAVNDAMDDLDAGRLRGRGALRQWHLILGTWLLLPQLLTVATGLWWSYDLYRTAVNSLAGMPARPGQGGERAAGARGGGDAPPIAIAPMRI